MRISAKDVQKGLFQVLANCVRCGKLFAKSLRDICPECLTARTLMFDTIRKHLRKYPTSTVPDVVAALSVSLEDVVELIEQGSLILVDFPNFKLECERCGTATQSGRFCDACKAQLATQLADATSSVRAKREQSQQNQHRFYSRN